MGYSKLYMNMKAVYALGLFIINPFVCFLYCLFSLNSNKQIKFYISFFFALLAYNLVPVETMDLATNYNRLELLSTLTYTDVINLNFNILLNLYMKFIVDIGLSKQFIPFFITFFSYYILLTSYFKIKIKLGRIELILLVITISFMANANGLRHGLSSSLMIYAVVQLYYRQWYKFFLLGCLASIVHPYVIPVFFLAIIFIFFRLKPNFCKTTVVVVMLMFSFINITDLMVTFFDSLSFINGVEQLKMTYILGDKWGGAASYSNVEKIVNILVSIPFISVSISFLFFKKRNIFYFISFSLIIISFLTYDFFAMSLRYQYLSTLFFFFYFISIKSEEDKYNKIIMILFFGQLVSIVWYLFKFKLILLPTMKFIIFPLPLAFIFNVNNYILGAG